MSSSLIVDYLWWKLTSLQFPWRCLLNSCTWYLHLGKDQELQYTRLLSLWLAVNVRTSINYVFVTYMSKKHLYKNNFREIPNHFRFRLKADATQSKHFERTKLTQNDACQSKEARGKLKIIFFFMTTSMSCLPGTGTFQWCAKAPSLDVFMNTAPT